MKQSLKSLFILLVLVASARSQDRTLESIVQPGEELVYKVRWTFIRLGTLTIRTEPVLDDSTRFKVVMVVESSPGIPFIDIQEYNECVIRKGKVTTDGFFGNWRNGRDKTEIHVSYDEQNRRAICEDKDLTGKRAICVDTLSNVPPFVNGPSLFLLTRWLSREVQIVQVPTLVGSKVEQTNLDFTAEREEIEVAGICKPVRCRKYSGSAEWNGGTTAGLSGKFCGWISDDSASVVVMAKMKVMLGSLTLELEQWHRLGWNPATSQSLVQK